MADLYIVPKGDARFFINRDAYYKYRAEERELMKEPIRLEFDWRLFLRIVFLGVDNEH